MGPHTPQTGQLLAACHSLEVPVQCKHFCLQSTLWLDPVSAHCNKGEPAGAGFPVLRECACRGMPYALNPVTAHMPMRGSLPRSRCLAGFKRHLTALQRRCTTRCSGFVMHRLICQ